MLDENKLIYQNYADQFIPQWRKIGKNELCNLYIQHEDDYTLSNAYFSAILCKYWNLIQKYYAMSENVASPEDAYEWLVNSVTYALQHRSWLRKDSSIYNDPNGPDKVINRCMKCARITYYQAINRKKRKDGVLTISLDSIKEDFNDSTTYVQDIEGDDFSSDVILETYIKNLFLEGDVLGAILIDMMAHYSVFDIEIKKDNIVHGKFNSKRLIKLVKKIDRAYYESFADMYQLQVDFVQTVIDNFMSKISDDEINTVIEEKLIKLRDYSYFVDCASRAKIDLSDFLGEDSIF